MSDLNRDRYLNLLEGCLTRLLFTDGSVGPGGYRSEVTPNSVRAQGRDWPREADTMIGKDRLHNIRICFEHIHVDGIPGDLVEAGVWRGGATIFMKALLDAYDEVDRHVWVADSFQGLPSPDNSVEADRIDLSGHAALRIPRAEVEHNFARYGLLDDRVRFLEGWFQDTLSKAPIDQIALLRVDADMYKSTLDVLDPLYDKVAPGGFVIVDDFGALEPCRRAVDEFRLARGITEPIEWVDWSGIYWRKFLDTAQRAPNAIT